MKHRFMALVAVAAACMLVVAAPAYADPPPGKGPPEKVTTTHVLPSQTPGESPITVTIETETTPLATDEVTTGNSFARASVAAATIYQVSWSLKMESLLWGIAWREVQKGLYFRNGTYVWQNSRFGWDNYGYHACGQSSGIGFTITVQSCYKRGDPSTGHMTLGDQFRVSVLFKGFPIYATHEMAVCAYPGGRLTTCIWS